MRTPRQRYRDWKWQRETNRYRCELFKLDINSRYGKMAMDVNSPYPPSLVDRHASQCPFCQNPVYDLPGRDSGMRHHIEYCPQNPNGEYGEDDSADTPITVKRNWCPFCRNVIYDVIGDDSNLHTHIQKYCPRNPNGDRN